jgi:metal-sulfur cluster biosynthetic enzyme
MAITEDVIRDALRDVIDPELGVNIIDLGLVYAIEIADTTVRVVMTMTSPACPLGGYLRDLVDQTLRWRLPDAHDVQIEIVWEPPWHPDMITAAGQQQLYGRTNE